MISQCFDLDSGVTNAEIMFKLMREMVEEAIAGMAAGHDKMGSEGGLGRADRPDVEIMNGLHSA